MRERFRGWAAAVLVTMLIVVGCGTTPTAQTPSASPAPVAPAPAAMTDEEYLAKLYEGAKQEGELTWYTTFPEDQANKLLATFTAKYPGIKTGIFRGTGSAVAQRVETETRANRFVVDVISIASMAPVLNWKNQNWLANFGDLPVLKEYAPKYKDKDGTWIWGSLSAYGIMYNTNLLKPEEVPQTWKELLDPKWTGKIALVPPWASDVAREWAFYVETELKITDGAKRMGALQPLLGKVHADAAQAVSSGERLLGPQIDYTFSGVKAKGAPVAFVYPKDGTTMSPRPFVLLEKSPHPNAAKLFLNWILTEAGQTQIGEGIRFHSARIGQKAPAGLQPFSELSGMEIDPVALGKVSGELAKRWQEEIEK